METYQTLRPSLWERLQFLTLGPRDLQLYLISRTYFTFMWGMNLLPPRFLE